MSSGMEIDAPQHEAAGAPSRAVVPSAGAVLDLAPGAAAAQDQLSGLVERAGVLAGRLSRLCGQLVEVAAQALECQEQIINGGFRSLEHFLAVHTNLSRSQCRALVDLATRGNELPTTLERLRQGAIALDQAGAIARRVPAWAEHTAATIAQGTTTSQFTRVVARYSFDQPDPETENHNPHPDHAATKDAAGEEVTGAHAAADNAAAGSVPLASPSPVPMEQAPSLRMDHREGRFFLRYETDAASGALVEQAIREAKDVLFTAGQADVTLADAVAEVASRSLGAIDSPARRDHYRIMVHLNTDGRGWLHKRGALPTGLLQRITCDGQVRPVWLTEGHPVSVGRSQRIVPERTRRLVEDRDQGCRFPGCGARGYLENHHLTHWAEGGRTDIDQLLSLCSFHHDAHHRGQFTITGTPTTPDGLIFTTATGLPIARTTSTGTTTRELSAKPTDTHEATSATIAGELDHHASALDPEGIGATARPGDQLEADIRAERWWPADWQPDRSFPRGERLETRWLSFGIPPWDRPDRDPPDPHHRE